MFLNVAMKCPCSSSERGDYYVSTPFAFRLMWTERKVLQTVNEIQFVYSFSNQLLSIAVCQVLVQLDWGFSVLEEFLSSSL